MNATGPESRARQWGILPGLVVVLVSTVLIGAPGLDRREPVSDPCDADLLGDLFQPLVTPLQHPPKRDKAPLSTPLSAKRPGFQRVTTTLFNVHTKEAVPVLKGLKPPDEVLHYLFRCRGFGTAHPVDERLVATLIAAAEQFETQRVEIISAYRSPKFNEALAKKGRRVASESRHMKGEAIDFRLVNVPARKVGRWLQRHFDGGVGTYSRSNFVHIDVGPKRRWYGR